MKITKLRNGRLAMLAAMAMGAGMVRENRAAVHVVGPVAALRAETVKPGDTVELKDGVYTQMPPVVSGTAQAPVTYRAAHPGGAIIDTLNQGETPRVPFDLLKGTGLSMTGAAHVRFQGLRFRNCRMGIQLGGDTQDVVIEDTEISGARLGVRVGAARDFVFRRVRLHHNAKGVYLDTDGAHHGLFDSVISEFNDDGKGRAGDGDGFQMKPEVHHIAFRRCVARGNSEDGIDIKGADCAVDGCVLAQNGGTALKSWNTGTRVVNSLAWGNTRGFAFGNFYPLRNGGLPALGALIQCTAAANRNENLSLGPDMTLEMRSNIIASFGSGVAVTYAIKVDEKAAHQPLRLVSFLPALGEPNPANPAAAERTALNLFWAADPKELLVTGAGKRKVSAEELSAGKWELASDSVSFIVADPELVDAAANNFRVQSTGRLAGAGLGAPAPTLDLDFATRPGALARPPVGIPAVTVPDKHERTPSQH